MASARRSSVGERVLEGRHVIGLFFLMLLFSGVFFTLGYVMGRNQFEGQVRAEGAAFPTDMVVKAKPEVEPKRSKDAPQLEPATDPVTPPSSDWEFYHAGESKAADDHLQPAPKNSATKPATAAAKNLSPAIKPAVPASGKSVATPQPASRAAFTVQVAALKKQADAIAVAQSLQKKQFPAYVIPPPRGDKYYRVQVGPYPNQKAADAARKSIESAGFKAIVKHG